MTIEEFMEYNGIEDEEEMPQYMLPWDVFSGGILGLTDDGNHIIYGYYRLADALAGQYEADWRKSHPDGEPDEDFNLMAREFIDYNTLRALPYESGEKRPFVIVETDFM